LISVDPLALWGRETALAGRSTFRRSDRTGEREALEFANLSLAVVFEQHSLTDRAPHRQER
jgi:hypothetical protein